MNRHQPKPLISLFTKATLIALPATAIFACILGSVKICVLNIPLGQRAVSVRLNHEGYLVQHGARASWTELKLFRTAKPTPANSLPWHELLNDVRPKQWGGFVYADWFASNTRWRTFGIPHLVVIGSAVFFSAMSFRFIFRTRQNFRADPADN